ncbi:MAG TPA: ROK family protein, partial [Anaerolineales bacterium]
MLQKNVLTQTSSPAGRRLLIGLDVGGTKIGGIAVEDGGVVRGRIQALTDTSSARDSVDSILNAIRQVLTAANAAPEEVRAIGLGIPGKIQAGMVSLAVNLKLESYPLAAALAEIYQAPVFLENDVRAAALGVYQWCQAQIPVENLVYLSIGTGISAGVILRGKLYRGSHGMAGEVGHIIVNPDGPRCNCGAFGCLETLAAGPAIARQGSLAIEAGTDTLLKRFSPVTANHVYDSARQGDLAAQLIVREASRHLSRAIYALLMAYDADVLVLGG